MNEVIQKVPKSVSANKKEPSQSWGSKVSDVPSSSLDECRSSKFFSVKLGNDHIAKILGYGDYQIGNVMISRVYYMEGLGHNLFSVSKKKPHQPKSEDTNQEKLYLFHMDLCGPMRVASVNGKKYILVIVNDYSRFTWVKFLRLKYKASDFIIKFLKMIQVRLQVNVRRIRIDNGTEFVNQTLREYYENIGISHETFVARSPQQNGVIERRNRTLIEATRTMLIYAKASLFLWAEAVATASPEVIDPIAEVVAPVPAVSIGSPSSIVDQDASSLSNFQTTLKTQPPVIPNDVEEDNHDIEVAYMGNDPYFGIP
ncbi:retrovirus-related pol polyprotein from transposon TNT 1-94, partial [Tanacetum coccineum]